MEYILLGLIVVVIAAVGWWLLIASEGVYLGRRTVVWLYDLYARRYDSIKGYRSVYEHMFLSQPLMEAIAPQKSPLVLDVATGTGRLPLAMVHHAHFNGLVIGVDLSRRMLAEATRKFPGEKRVMLMHAPAENLPFADGVSDITTCLEALEFMTRREQVLYELVRVTRPGGLLLVTNRVGDEARLMPGKTWTQEQIEGLLREAGMAEVRTERWQVDYDLVWAWKIGKSAVTGMRPVTEVLRCPACSRVAFAEQHGGYRCGLCGKEISTGVDGVIEIVV